jgi:hypothetical protein
MYTKESSVISALSCARPRVHFSLSYSNTPVGEKVLWWILGFDSHVKRKIDDEEDMKQDDSERGGDALP